MRVLFWHHLTVRQGSVQYKNNHKNQCDMDNPAISVCGIVQHDVPTSTIFVGCFVGFVWHTRDVLNIIHGCEQRGAVVTILNRHVSTRGEMGHMVLSGLDMVAQLERRFIKERQREGIKRAKTN